MYYLYMYQYINLQRQPHCNMKCMFMSIVSEYCKLQYVNCLCMVCHFDYRSINQRRFQSLIPWSWPSKPFSSPRTTGPVPCSRPSLSMGTATVSIIRYLEWWPSSRLEPAWCSLSIYRTLSSLKSSFNTVDRPLIFSSLLLRIVIQVFVNAFLFLILSCF